jgi:lipopolysaccharide export system permease protein
MPRGAVRLVTPDGNMRNVRIIEFDKAGRLASISEAKKKGSFGNAESWILGDVTHRDSASRSSEQAGLTPIQTLPQIPMADPRSRPKWCRSLCCSPKRIPTIDLFQFVEAPG